MKNQAQEILKKYLSINDEVNKLQVLTDFLKRYEGFSVADWNNFDGHIVASSFIYSKKDNRFLTLYHKEFNVYIYPGGHITSSDKTILDAAKRETKEETGITEYKVISPSDDINVPIDIDIHRVAYNKLLDLPEHYHFDFRYFFLVDEIGDVILDNESEDYLWVTLDDIKNNPVYGHIYKKLEKIIDNI